MGNDGNIINDETMKDDKNLIPLVTILCLVCLGVGFVLCEKITGSDVTKNMQKEAVKAGCAYYDSDKKTGDMIFKYRECKCFQGNKE